MEIEELSAKVDQYVSAREARLALQRKTDELAETEKLLKDELIATLEKSGVNAVGGTTHIVKLSVKEKPTASDWPKIYSYIKKNNAFDLLQRRLNEAAVEARWEVGKKIPGVTTFPVATLSISKGA